MHQLDPKTFAVAKLSPEIYKLPSGWTFSVDKDKRVYFIKGTETTYNHPELGGLPKPWILKVVSQPDGTVSIMYYNRENKITTRKDPRFTDKNLTHLRNSAPKELQIAASSQKNNNLDITKMQRSPVATHDIRGNYRWVHTIDEGNGSKGGMNGGVFVVYMDGVPNRLYIEKRFKASDIVFAKQEILMMRKLKHFALTSYSAAFIIDRPNLKAASVYIEFCDRGSLDDLITEYGKRHRDNPKPYPPEPFVWHAFGGLLDALAYLQTGTSMLHKKDARLDPKWIPIVHRDIKPDNVLLRSRTTIGSRKYFYCVLSDFGLACEDRPDSDPLADSFQKSRLILGTPPYLAPELCHHPWPKSPDDKRFFPPRRRHSQMSDVWALGASIYNLCVCSGDAMCHIDFRSQPRPLGMDDATAVMGANSRRDPLTIPAKYTSQLAKAVHHASAWDPTNRPDAVRLIRLFEELQKSSGYMTQQDADLLPDWATRKHEYFSKAEKNGK